MCWDSFRLNLYEVGYDGLGVFDIIGDGDNDAKSGLAPSSEVEPSMSSESNSMLQNVKIMIKSLH